MKGLINIIDYSDVTLLYKISDILLNIKISLLNSFIILNDLLFSIEYIQMSVLSPARLVGNHLPIPMF